MLIIKLISIILTRNESSIPDSYLPVVWVSLTSRGVSQNLNIKLILYSRNMKYEIENYVQEIK